MIIKYFIAYEYDISMNSKKLKYFYEVNHSDADEEYCSIIRKEDSFLSDKSNDFILDRYGDIYIYSIEQIEDRSQDPNRPNRELGHDRACILQTDRQPCGKAVRHSQTNRDQRDAEPHSETEINRTITDSWGRTNNICLKCNHLSGKKKLCKPCAEGKTKKQITRRCDICRHACKNNKNLCKQCSEDGGAKFYKDQYLIAQAKKCDRKIKKHNKNAPKSKDYEERDSILKRMGFGSYKEYLKSHIWKNIKHTLIDEAEIACKCKICDSNNATTIHHEKYTEYNLRGQNYDYLIPICNTCHSAIHNKQV